MKLNFIYFFLFICFNIFINFFYIRKWDVDMEEPLKKKKKLTK